MAYRVVVEKPQRIRALVSSANIVVADAQLVKTQVLVTKASYAASISSRVANVFSAYVYPVTEIYYRNVSAEDVALDPFSLNKYFRLDQAVMAEALSVLASKGVDDVSGLSDRQDFLIGKGISDGFAMGDEAVVLLEILRAFTEDAFVTDSQERSLGVVKSEAIGVADIAVTFTTKSLSDGTDLSEQAIFDTSKALIESASLSEQLLKTSVFQRSFSDALVLDDFTDVNAVQKDTIATKTNVIGFSDIQSFVTEKTLQDTASLTELAALSTERAASDSLSVGDVFQKVTTFSRAISDSTFFSDSSSAAIGKELSDTAAMSEAFQKDLTYNRTLSDAVSFAEQSVAAFDKGLSDVASITESIQITTSSLASSVLNASALNSVPLNN